MEQTKGLAKVNKPQNWVGVLHCLKGNQVREIYTYAYSFETVSINTSTKEMWCETFFSLPMAGVKN